MKWLLLCYTVPSDTSRHRVAVWRELRRIGAVSPQQAVWALPDNAGSRHALEDVVQLVEGAGGEALLVRAEALDEAASDKRLEELYIAAREEEYTEFLAECDKFEAEIDSEIRKHKFTSAELDEEEQNLDRLVRWHRDLARKTFFAVASSSVAEKRLKECEQSLSQFADLVFEAEQA